MTDTHNIDSPGGITCYSQRGCSRRDFVKGVGVVMALLGGGTPLKAALAAGSGKPTAGADTPRRLRMLNLHTNERIDITFKTGNRHDTAALSKLDWFFRDHRKNTSAKIDPALYDLLSVVQDKVGGRELQLVSGYRSPATNDKLRTRPGSTVAKKSFHMRGMAADICVEGVSTEELRDIALSMQDSHGLGGVGYYKRGFVHIDTGPKRSW